MESEQVKEAVEKVVEGSLGRIEDQIHGQRDYLKTISGALDDICQVVGVKFSKIPGKTK